MSGRVVSDPSRRGLSDKAHSVGYTLEVAIQLDSKGVACCDRYGGDRLHLNRNIDGVAYIPCTDETFRGIGRIGCSGSKYCYGDRELGRNLGCSASNGFPRHVQLKEIFIRLCGHRKDDVRSTDQIRIQVDGERSSFCESDRAGTGGTWNHGGGGGGRPSASPGDSR